MLPPATATFTVRPVSVEGTFSIREVKGPRWQAPGHLSSRWQRGQIAALALRSSRWRIAGVVHRGDSGRLAAAPLLRLPVLHGARADALPTARAGRASWRWPRSQTGESADKRAEPASCTRCSTGAERFGEPNRSTSRSTWRPSRAAWCCCSAAGCRGRRRPSCSGTPWRSNETSYAYFARAPSTEDCRRPSGCGTSARFWSMPIRWWPRTPISSSATRRSTRWRASPTCLPLDATARLAGRSARCRRSAKGSTAWRSACARRGDERPANAEFLRELILAPEDDFRAGFDGILGGYLLLAGERGAGADRVALPGQSAGGRRRRAARADGAALLSRVRPRDSGRAARRRRWPDLLARGEFADAAITDLARWKDWSTARRESWRSIRRNGSDDRHAPRRRGLSAGLSRSRRPAALAQLRQADPQGVAAAEQVLSQTSSVPAPNSRDELAADRYSAAYSSSRSLAPAGPASDRGPACPASAGVRPSLGGCPGRSDTSAAFPPARCDRGRSWRARPRCRFRPCRSFRAIRPAPCMQLLALLADQLVADPAARPRPRSPTASAARLLFQLPLQLGDFLVLLRDDLVGDANRALDRLPLGDRVFVVAIVVLQARPAAAVSGLPNPVRRRRRRRLPDAPRCGTWPVWLPARRWSASFRAVPRPPSRSVAADRPSCADLIQSPSRSLTWLLPRTVFWPGRRAPFAERPVLGSYRRPGPRAAGPPNARFRPGLARAHCAKRGPIRIPARSIRPIARPFRRAILLAACASVSWASASLRRSTAAASSTRRFSCSLCASVNRASRSAAPARACPPRSALVPIARPAARILPIARRLPPIGPARRPIESGLRPIAAKPAVDSSLCRFCWLCTSASCVSRSRSSRASRLTSARIGSSSAAAPSAAAARCSAAANSCPGCRARRTICSTRPTRGPRPRWHRELRRPVALAQPRACSSDARRLSASAARCSSSAS